MTYLFTIIHCFTRWPEAIPIPDAKASTCAKALTRHCIARFGVPQDITSDRGAQFTSSLWSELGRTLGVQMQQTTAYHPQANRMIDDFTASSKVPSGHGLRILIGWIICPWYFLGYVQLGARIPIALLPNWFTALLFDSREKSWNPHHLKSYNLLHFFAIFKSYCKMLFPHLSNIIPHPNPTSLPLSFSSTGFVYVRIDGHQNPLQLPYNGPFLIISTSDKYFTLDIHGRPDNVFVDKLKPAYVGTSGQKEPSFLTNIAPEQHRYSKPPQEADASPNLQVISRTFVPHSIATSYALLTGGTVATLS